MNGPKVWLGWDEGSKQCPETYSSPLTDSKSSQGLLRPPEDPETPSLPRLSLHPGGRPHYLLHSSTKVSRSSLLGFFCLS